MLATFLGPRRLVDVSQSHDHSEEGRLAFRAFLEAVEDFLVHDDGFPFAIELVETTPEPEIDRGRDGGQLLEFREQFLRVGDRLLELIVGWRELGDVGWISPDRGQILLDPALHARDAIVL